MYVHLGGEYSISDRFIVGIFDFDKTTASQQTIEFLQQAEQQDLVEYVLPDIPRSFVVTLDRIYMTPISVSTLRRRLEERKFGIVNYKQ